MVEASGTAPESSLPSSIFNYIYIIPQVVLNVNINITESGIYYITV